jgi:hypothetical protein
MTRVVTLVHDISAVREVYSTLPVSNRSLRCVLRVSGECVVVEWYEPVTNHVL